MLNIYRTWKDLAGAHARAGIALLIVAIALGTGAAALAKPQVPQTHHVVILVDSDDEKIMGHAIGYSVNLNRYFATKNERVAIEIVANGSGIVLFRADRSPLQQELSALQQSFSDINLSMCNSSKEIAEQREGHKIDLISGARLVPFGIGRVVELQEKGWTFIHA
ncbi:DsrE family protein [Oryzifoliimicrobium ureilyticus]|uniref:DsrE family protein n=1 Tax=Oryzifoliimicrobium ureilyticus TaxID=3113724 RepID=UPI003075FA9C